MSTATFCQCCGHVLTAFHAVQVELDSEELQALLVEVRTAGHIAH